MISRRRWDCTYAQPLLQRTDSKFRIAADLSFTRAAAARKNEKNDKDEGRRTKE